MMFVVCKILWDLMRSEGCICIYSNLYLLLCFFFIKCFVKNKDLNCCNYLVINYCFFGFKEMNFIFFNCFNY